mmetsp:Transcript_4161/g.13168  ORF Transcript_4161/g.13168 Transcript_4161/m.13168 type:complete len:239 (+) Transcript_4161:751-1467(+)
MNEHPEDLPQLGYAPAPQLLHGGLAVPGEPREGAVHGGGGGQGEAQVLHPREAGDGRQVDSDRRAVAVLHRKGDEGVDAHRPARGAAGEVQGCHPAALHEELEVRAPAQAVRRLGLVGDAPRYAAALEHPREPACRKRLEALDGRRRLRCHPPAGRCAADEVSGGHGPAQGGSTRGPVAPGGSRRRPRPAKILEQTREDGLGDPLAGGHIAHADVHRDGVWALHRGDLMPGSRRDVQD